MYAFKRMQRAAAKEASMYRFGGLSVAAVALGLAASTPSCSLIVDTNTDQCAANTDCPGGAQCLDGVCVGGGCQTNAECVTQLGDDFSICRKSDKRCALLKSEQCQTVEGDYKSDDAFIFGSIHPTAGPDGPIGLPIENSIRLAVGEFKDTSNGLPPASGSTARRPMVMIGCNDDGTGDIAVLAARHLVDDVGVSAIIGGAFSSIAIKMATEVTIPESVLLISSSATSDDITFLDDKPPGAQMGAAGLVWRSSPADSFQAAALAAYINTKLQNDVRTAAGLMPTDPINLAVLHRGDSYGEGLGTKLEDPNIGLKFNGGSPLDAVNTGHYVRVSYGDNDDEDPPFNPGSATDAALNLKAHIVIILGFSEAISPIFTDIENNWTEAAYRPYYVFPDGGRIPDLHDAVNTFADKDGLRKRISGSVPGTTHPRFNAFVQAYKLKFTDGLTDPTVFGAAGAYDAAYLLAYSVASLQGGPPLGTALAEGLRKMSMINGGDAAVDVGKGDLNRALTTLTGGATIDFEGASGPLQFDPNTGEAPSDVQIWCLPRNGTDADAGVSSGLFYNAASKALEGSVNTTTCGLP
jgi:ABC-type branched-subunit amino acid transport system substrate-binding protein